MHGRVRERERKINSMYEFKNNVTVEGEKELILKLIYNGMEIVSGRFPTHIPREPIHY